MKKKFMKRYIKSATQRDTLYDLCKQWSDTYVFYHPYITVVDMSGNLLYEGSSLKVLRNDSDFCNRMVVDISVNPENGYRLIQVE